METQITALTATVNALVTDLNINLVKIGDDIRILNKRLSDLEAKAVTTEPLLVNEVTDES